MASSFVAGVCGTCTKSERVLEIPHFPPKLIYCRPGARLNKIKKLNIETSMWLLQKMPKTRANGRNIVGCFMLRPFTHPVASTCCCANFETFYFFIYVQTDTTTSNIVGLDKNFAFVCTKLFQYPLFTSLRQFMPFFLPMKIPLRATNLNLLQVLSRVQLNTK